MNPINAKDIAEFLEASITPESMVINDFKPISIAGKGDMAFCSAIGEKGINLVKNSNASLIICHTSLEGVEHESSLLFVDNPRLYFIRCINHFLKTKPNPIIKIGKNNLIDKSSVIGSDGFGFEKVDGKWIKFPDIGGVEIGDDVEIGANTCIDRGTLGNTIIGNGTKIDNLVHIAHNAIIGKNCLIVAMSVIGGSCVIGDDVFIGIGALIRDGIKIGKNSIIGMGAVVVKNVPDNVTVVGNPAHNILEGK